MEPDLMNVITAFVKPFQLPRIVDATRRIPNFPGMSVTEVRGFGSHAAHPPQKGERTEIRPFEAGLRIDVFCQSADLIVIEEAIRTAAYTGHTGDGKIFAGPITLACRIRTGEVGVNAIAVTHEQ